MTTSNPPYTVIGTPYSTFTRTIALGLQYKGLKYNHISTLPHSAVAVNSHPFGYIPTLIIHEVDGSGRPMDIKLSESQVIARYIDRIAPEPTLLEGSGQLLPERMWEFVSFAASYGFPIIERGVVKPRVQALDEGKLSDEEVREQIKPGVVKLKEYLSFVESFMVTSTDGYLFGEKLTWADFFLFPLLDDLRAVPEWEVVSERLIAWMKKMDDLPAVKETSAGTLSVGARPA
ncbi:hypothetical protein BYT27DRAFT_7198631 [Phlegmacium glaucopus]|nr:hypothetical protein BYT27DRAFT_7198631 [Phlegmacium glaucopus]